MSTLAGPESGLTSSIMEWCSAAAPRPVNHWSGPGPVQSWAINGEVPERSARRPGARSSFPLTTWASAPESGVVARGLTATGPEDPPEVTVTLPDAPLAVEAAALGEPRAAAGQTTVALESLVSDGGAAVSRSGGGWTSASR